MALNGQFPSNMLVNLGWPEADHLRLTPDAAASLNSLAVAFEQHFGEPLYLSDAYRTLAEQKRLKITKGAFAAQPGTSNHGWGLAIDMASRINVDNSAEHQWMEANGPYYGWINPWWAENYIPRDGQHEPWHWEYHDNLNRSALVKPTAATPTPLTDWFDMATEADLVRIIDARLAAHDARARADIMDQVDKGADRVIRDIANVPGVTVRLLLDAVISGGQSTVGQLIRDTRMIASRIAEKVGAVPPKP